MFEKKKIIHPPPVFGEAEQKRREETTSVAELFAEQGSRGKKPRARRTEAESRRFAERNKRRKLAVSRRFNFSELIPKLGAGGSLAAYGGRGTRHGRTKKTRNGMNGTVSRLGLGNEIYKRASPDERECTVQVQFSSGQQSFVDVAAAVLAPASFLLCLSLSLFLILYFLCFSLPFHPFRSTPRSFSPRPSIFFFFLFSPVDHVSPVFTGLIAFSRANITRLG